MLRLQQDIKQQVDQKMTNQKRTYFLQEQLKSIKKELGLEKDDKEAILNKFRDRRKKIKVRRQMQEMAGMMGWKWRKRRDAGGGRGVALGEGVVERDRVVQIVEHTSA